MIVQAAYFILGLVVLLISTNYLVKTAEMVACRLKLSSLIVGITVVAIGTSLPELVVSTVSAMRDDYGLALGNIVGSNIVNILFVLPIGILIGKLRIGTTKTQRSVWLLLGTTCLYALLYLLSLPSVVIGVILLSLGLTVTYLEYTWGRKGSVHEDSRRLGRERGRCENFSGKTVMLLILSLTGICVGGLILVSATESISLLLGYSTTILGLSLTAVATSLPELFTTVFSQEEHDEKLTVGNVLGSNVYNLAIIGGIVAFFAGGSTQPLSNWLWLFGTTLAFFTLVKAYKGRVVTRLVSVLFLGVFLGYLCSLAVK